MVIKKIFLDWVFVFSTFLELGTYLNLIYEAVISFLLTDYRGSSRVKKFVSYHFKFIIMFRIDHSLFCHKNDHVCLVVCQCETFSKKRLEEFPNVIHKTCEHEQEISNDTIGGCCIDPNFISDSIYGFYSPSFSVNFHIRCCFFLF